MAAIYRSKRKLLSWGSLIVYLVSLCYFLFFSESMGRSGTAEYHYNLTLFHEIKRFWKYWETVGLASAVLNLAGNVVAFVPFGYLVANILRPRERWYVISLLSFLFSLGVEVTQLITKSGCFDVDDLLLNTIGGLLGYLVYFILHSCKKETPRKSEK